MPNTPALVSTGASGYSLGTHATDADNLLVSTLLNSVGKSWRVDEKFLDAVCGLSGSGPAFVYLVIEALADGGVFVGLPRDMAIQLAAQTVLGAAQMVLSGEGKHTAQLKDAVTSPGGTTITGLRELEKAGVRAALMEAVIAATNKSMALGKPKL
eukprot:TRINITY_DN6358_c0_g1_i3.p1 TRINITY_DN6358_c0_g1~~TRINITY_DN6358_c0_g1_i3.p1  ORF type:complete len:155 (-),score=23.84 TRINITY_DN6358_c0_g1_i3:30-494(-)